MKKQLKLLIFAIFILSACAAPMPTPAPTLTPIPATVTPEPSPTPISVTDGLGRSVTLPKTAQRIVSAAPSNTEILFAVGAGSQVVGRDDFSDYPPEASDLPSVGGSMGAYNYEAMIALQPDLVLMTGINTPEQVKALEDVGITVYYLPNPTTLEEMYANLETVGKLSGHEQEATTLVESLKVRVKAVTERVMVYSFLPGVFYELDASTPAQPWTTGAGTFMDMLISMAGGHNVFNDMNTSWAQVSQEELIVRDPYIILLGDSAYGITIESIGQRPGWDVLSAVKNGRVYAFDDNLVSRPGPRLVDGLEALAEILHPTK
jgi:iron complex transport system substrate-binding protein